MISRISILVFNNVEVLDFSGPFEVFHTARSYCEGPPPIVELVSPTTETIQTVGRMQIQATTSMDRCLHTDLLVIPGGAGTRPLLNQPQVIDWIAQRSRQAILTLSVCTGALLLAKAGLLNQLTITTHHSALSELKQLAPRSDVQTNRRFIDNGEIITAAGISAGIDASLYTVARIYRPETAEQVAHHMEYDWHS
jgi:transcriptional regulator GlxA family with amidase domain